MSVQLIDSVQIEAPQKSHNRVDLQLHRQDFVAKGQKFEVSSRYITPQMSILEYLSLYFGYLDPKQIKSIFGNTQFPSKLYGGRTYNLAGALTDEHLAQMDALGIGLNLTLSNHFFDEEVYQQNKPFLARHHHEKNSIICVNDKLARRIRTDFPKYQLIASLIKHAHTLDRVEKALAIYDEVVIPMDMNDDDQFLTELPEKHRIILFVNANCAYNCPSRSCYAGFSQSNSGMEVTGHCSIPVKQRLGMGHVYFDIAKFRKMGFSYFKLVPPDQRAPFTPSERTVQLIQNYRNQKVSQIVSIKRQQNQLFFICSYPKSGRTWLRFMLAHYLSLKFNLGIQINLQSIFTLLPNSDRGLKGLDSYQFMPHPEIPLVLFSHSNAREGVPLVGSHSLLIRSVPDVVVSDYFHQSKLLENFKGSLKEYLHANEGGLHRYCRFLNSWTSSSQPKPNLVLSYEALHQTPKEALTQLLINIGVEVDPLLIEQAISESSFSKMKNSEDSHGIAGHSIKSRGDEGRRVRKGIVGGYQEYLDEEEVSFIYKFMSQHLTENSQRLLKEQGLYNI